MTKTNGSRVLARFRPVRDAATAIAALGIVLATSSPARAQGACKPGSPLLSPAVLTEISKNPDLADDFLHFGFLPVTAPKPTTLARPNAIRAFVTYSQFFEPSVPLEQATRYVGLEPNPAQTFLAIRCLHPNLEVLQPVLAKWPNVFNALLQDFGAGVTCPPATGTAREELVCILRSFVDTPQPTATEALANLYDVAAMITGNPTLQAFISQQYGVATGFSGLGLAVKGSGVSGLQFTAEGVEDGAIVPEYLTENASIAAAGCRCILVPPYPGRDEARLDPDFVWRRGSPDCAIVDHLPEGMTCSISDVVATEATPPPTTRHAVEARTPGRLGWTVHPIR